jgi:hypothetical protein
VFARLDQRNGGAFAAGPADASDAMHVQLGSAWHVVVHHVRELLDVEAACGNIGGYEKIKTAAA